MKYPDEYLYAKDIDWFCKINENYIHVASAGGLLPTKLNDRDKLREMQRIVFQLPDIFTDQQLIYNAQILNSKFNGNQVAISDYLSSFKSMARKGFISVDRTNIDDLSINIYHIVCMPPNNNGQHLNINEICSFTIKDQHVFDSPHGGIKLLELLN